jgi:poly-gamma-glutamate synthesis protein (capsule biosynthesis protein)
MKALKRAAFGLLCIVCSGLLAVSFSAHAEEEEASGAADRRTSTWARESVMAAYEQGLVAQDFDLGKDYTVPITRLQLARLAVDFVAAKKYLSIPDLLQETAPAEEASAQAGQEPGEVPEEGETAAEHIDTQSGAELPEMPESSFSDTKSPYAELALNLGLMKGSVGIFRPDDTVTRTEAAVVLQRCMAALGVTEANEMPMAFKDTYLIPRWGIEAAKFVSGRTGSSGEALMGGAAGLFDPDGSFTIEQAIITLLRMNDSIGIKTVRPDWREAPGYNLVQITMSFGGDCTFGRGKDFAYRNSFDEMYDQKGAGYFFSGIDEFFSDDLTMVNFEGTLTNAASSADKTFVFKGRPEYAQILREGSIDVVSIANNHSMDYLQQGFEETIQNLSPNVAVSGYDMMPVVTVKGVRIGFASNVGWSFDEEQKRFIRDAIRNLREAGADLIVFNYHWGIEQEYRSNATQRAIARYCIDEGADLVIGHHPHVVQETETYKGGQIAYSLGNLVFGGNQNPSDKNCLIFRQAFIFDLDKRQVVSETYETIPYLVSSVAWRNDYHPVRAD